MAWRADPKERLQSGHWLEALAHSEMQSKQKASVVSSPHMSSFECSCKRERLKDVTEAGIKTGLVCEGLQANGTLGTLPPFHYGILPFHYGILHVYIYSFFFFFFFLKKERK